MTQAVWVCVCLCECVSLSIGVSSLPVCFLKTNHSLLSILLVSALMFLHYTQLYLNCLVTSNIHIHISLTLFWSHSTPMTLASVCVHVSHDISCLFAYCDCVWGKSLPDKQGGSLCVCVHACVCVSIVRVEGNWEGKYQGMKEGIKMFCLEISGVGTSEGLGDFITDTLLSRKRWLSVIVFFCLCHSFTPAGGNCKLMIKPSETVLSYIHIW